jgi:hypothetical protein
MVREVQGLTVVPLLLIAGVHRPCTIRDRNNPGGTEGVSRVIVMSPQDEEKMEWEGG